MTAKLRSRKADRLQDGVIVALVVAALGFAATASRADRDGAWTTVSVVDSPAVCADARVEGRGSCLKTALALATQR